MFFFFQYDFFIFLLSRSSLCREHAPAPALARSLARCSALSWTVRVAAPSERLISGGRGLGSPVRARGPTTITSWSERSPRERARQEEGKEEVVSGRSYFGARCGIFGTGHGWFGRVRMTWMSFFGSGFGVDADEDSC